MQRASIAILVVFFISLSACAGILYSNREALINAAKDGNMQLIENLLAKGADVNQKNDDGWTALMVAALNGHATIVKELLDHGADINAKNISGSTAVMLAAQEGYKEIVEILKQAGADGSTTVNVKDSHDWITEVAKYNSTEEALRDLKKSDIKIRADALRFLYKHPDPEAVDSIVDILRNDKNANIRMYAAIVLGTIKDKRSVSGLISALKDNSSDVRRGAASSLRSIGDNQAIQPLISALKECQGLIVQGETKDGIRADNGNIQYFDTPTALEIEETLKKLTGQDFGSDADKWEQWFKTHRFEKAGQGDKSSSEGISH